MTTTDLAAARRAVARKRPANKSRRRNPRVIDGQFRPTRSHRSEALKGVTLLLFALMFAGLVISMTSYYSA